MKHDAEDTQETADTHMARSEPGSERTEREKILRDVDERARALRTE